MSEIEFTRAVIRTKGKAIFVLLSDVVPVRDETEAGAVQRSLELGISRADPDAMEWEELDDLVQGRSELQFRINGKHDIPVDGWFGPTGSRVGIRLPNISLGIDLTWNNIEGPVETVEALWVDEDGTQELGSLLMRSLDYVPTPAWDDSPQQENNNGSGCGSAVLLVTACLLFVAANLLT